MPNSRVYEDVLVEFDGPTAILAINRPDRMNALRGRTVEELIAAFRTAWARPEIRSIILTGVGDRAFCAGGDVKVRVDEGNYGWTDSGMWELDYLHRLIRDVPKPVIAAVNGAAIGGGHVLHVLCDLSIAADTARFGQVGPRVGSFDAGFGTVYLARVLGEKRARELWFLCRQYDAAQAERWGLVNAVVPPEQLMDEARRWATEIAQMSPTALKFIKHSFNTDTEHQAGLANVASAGLGLYLETPEAREGVVSFTERRPPDFSAYSP